MEDRALPTTTAPPVLWLWAALFTADCGERTALFGAVRCHWATGLRCCLLPGGSALLSLQCGAAAHRTEERALRSPQSAVNSAAHDKLRAWRTDRSPQPALPHLRTQSAPYRPARNITGVVISSYSLMPVILRCWSVSG